MNSTIIFKKFSLNNKKYITYIFIVKMLK